MIPAAVAARKVAKFRARPHVPNPVPGVVAKTQRGVSWLLLALLVWMALSIQAEFGPGAKSSVLTVVLGTLAFLLWRLLRVVLVVVFVVALLNVVSPDVQQPGYAVAGCAPTGPQVQVAGLGHGAGTTLAGLGQGRQFTPQQVNAWGDAGRDAAGLVLAEAGRMIRLPELRAAYDAGWDGDAAPQPETGAIPAGFADCGPGTVPAVLPGPVGACPPTGLPGERRLRPNALRGFRCTVATFGIRDIGGFATSGHVAGSDHYSGNAIDVMLAGWQTPAGNARGDQVAAWFQTHAPELGVRYIIWDRQTWRPGGGWRPYTRGAGDPNLEHRNHVHISFLSGAVATAPAVQASYVGGPQ